MDNNMSNWTLVQSKQKLKKEKLETYNPSFDEIKNGIIMTLQKYNPYAIYIYGSRARGTNNINSDVDILVVWTFEPKNIEIMKNEIINKIKIKIDFVNLIYKEFGKEIKVQDFRDIYYYENLINEAINIYKNTQDNIYLKDIIQYSIKLPKI